MILKETIDQVLGLDIVEVISKYLELKRSGSNYKGKSPWTDERTASLMVSPAKQIFKDFSSGRGGNLITFVMEKESMEFPEAVRHLCGMFAIECRESEKSAEETIEDNHRETLRILTAKGQEYFRANYQASAEAQAYIMNERNITDEMISKFEIGYAPGTITGLTNWLINSGYNWNYAVQASLIGYLPDKNRLYDFFRNRLMFPIKNLTGNIIGFGGRLMVDNPKAPKYLNSGESMIYHKSHVVYGIFESKAAIIKADMAYLVEGYMDVVSWHQAGIENTVAVSGTALTSEQAKMIKRFSKRITIVFDGDRAGISAALRGIDVLVTEGMDVRVLVLPHGQDPDDFAKSNTAEQMHLYVSTHSKDFMIFKLNHLLEIAGQDLTARGNAITDTVGTISKLPNAIQREVYLRECARVTDTDINSLRVMLTSLVDESVDFSEVKIDNFQEQQNLSVQLIREQCERKILQYILAFGGQTLNFKELVISEDDTEAKGYREVLEIVSKTVFEKVNTSLTEDDISFTNPVYDLILVAIRNLVVANGGIFPELHQLNINLLPEQYLLAEQLRYEELMMNDNVFLKNSIHGNDIVRQDLILALEKSINETLLFYKTLVYQMMIDEMSKEENPDMQFLSDLIQLNLKVKRELNFI